MLWDDADNRKFVTSHFPWFLATYDAYDREIMRADAIRYMFLYKYGGIYADMDFECLKPMDELLAAYEDYDIILGSIRTTNNPWHVSNSIPNALMISKPNNAFWIHVLEEMVRRASASASVKVEELTGPVVLKGVYDKSWFSRIKVLPPSVLYPISWITDSKERAKSLKTEELTSLTQSMLAAHPSSYAVTYWTHSW
jgi:mannosyltransferase OCH1-like enzyme